ncbi:MAG TPA: autotransporter domain-containing protein [Elusimicrobiota bacterium]|nr:autotransporter domain-containing protein [Elusimicrobiota bacterium]
MFKVAQRLLACACALLLAAPARSATFTVTNTTDSSSGSLRDELTQSNTAGGTNTVSWGAGSGGTIAIASDLPSVADATTLDVTNAPSAVTISGANTMPLGGSVTFFNDNTSQVWTIGIVLGGAGTFIKDGAGTVALTAGNSFGALTINAGTLSVLSDAAMGAGGVTFNGGTLQTAAALTSNRAVTLNAGGGTIDTNGFDSTFEGVFSGAGGLTKTGAGTLFLTVANSYTGPTTVNGGVLNVGADAALGDSASTLVLNGGTLQAGKSFSSARAITLSAGGGTFDTNAYNMTLSGVLGGAGGLTKTGLGTLSLSGANAYAGATAISAGTLQLGANGALPAATALSVASGATFDMSGHTQTVQSFSGAGTTLLTLGSPLTVTGNADFTGGTLSVLLSHQAVVNGQTFIPITYGSRSGAALSSIVSPAALSFTPTYNANNLTLTAALVPFASSAVSANQAAIGTSMEPLRTAPTGDVSTVLGTLYTLDAPHLAAALDQIGPIALASMRGLGMSGAGVQSAAVGRRMAALADGSAPGGRASYVVSGPSSVPGTLLASTGEMGALDGAEGGPSDSPWGFFASGEVTTGRLREANSDSGSQPGYAFNNGGVTGGADYRVNEHLAVGGALGFLHGHASLYNPAFGTVDDQSVRYGAYAAASLENLHGDLYVGGAADFFSTNRGIAFGDVSRTARGTPRGSELNVRPGVSYDVRVADYGTFTPFGTLNYDRLSIGSFSETGADSLDLNVGSQTSESLVSSTGLRWSRKLEGDGYSVAPHVSLGWRHEFVNQNRPIEAQLASGGLGFSTATGDFARDGTLVGFGLAVNIDKTTLKLEYAGDFRSHYQENMINAGARWRF